MLPKNFNKIELSQKNLFILKMVLIFRTLFCTYYLQLVKQNETKLSKHILNVTTDFTAT